MQLEIKISAYHLKMHTNSLKVLVFLLVCEGVRHAYALRELESYNIDVNGVSVSGFSTGAAMAVQMHVAYSGVFMGVGVAAGVAYYCSRGSVAQSGLCMLDIEIDPADLAGHTRSFADSGKIDAVSYMQHSRVFLLHGQLDTLIQPGASNTTENYYLEFVPAGNIKSVRIPNMVHGFPTEDAGAPCSVLSPTRDYYINNCQYHGAFETLQWIYQDLRRPTSSTPTPGDFYEYSQEDFTEGPLSMMSISMASRGFIYVPIGCTGRQKACRLHVNLHGCSQGVYSVNDGYVSNSFFKQVAELNDIIILWPQVRSSYPGNVQECWDFWGYNDGILEYGDYATQHGDQTKALMEIVQKVIGNSV